jgi:hypothetical protein
MKTKERGNFKTKSFIRTKYTHSTHSFAGFVSPSRASPSVALAAAMPGCCSQAGSSSAKCTSSFSGTGTQAARLGLQRDADAWGDYVEEFHDSS